MTQTQDFALQSSILRLAPSSASSSTSKRTSVKLVDLEAYHLEYFAKRLRSDIDIKRCVGLCLIDENCTPLACGGVQFAHNLAFGFCYLGPHGFWWRRHPRLGMEATKRMLSLMHRAGHAYIYAEADATIPSAERTIRWLKGKPVSGGFYVIPTDRF